MRLKAVDQLEASTIVQVRDSESGSWEVDVEVKRRRHSNKVR